MVIDIVILILCCVLVGVCIVILRHIKQDTKLIDECNTQLLEEQARYAEVVEVMGIMFPFDGETDHETVLRYAKAKRIEKG